MLQKLSATMATNSVYLMTHSRSCSPCGTAIRRTPSWRAATFISSCNAPKGQQPAAIDPRPRTASPATGWTRSVPDDRRDQEGLPPEAGQERVQERHHLHHRKLPVQPPAKDEQRRGKIDQPHAQQYGFRRRDQRLLPVGSAPARTAWPRPRRCRLFLARIPATAARRSAARPTAKAAGGAMVVTMAAKKPPAAKRAAGGHDKVKGFARVDAARFGRRHSAE